MSGLKKIIAVTGGAGCLGQAILKQGTPEGFIFRVLARRRPAFIPPDTEWIQGDVRDHASREKLLVGVDSIIHAAALTRPNASRRDLASTNIEATDDLFEMALKNGVRHFAFVSSASVFGEEAGIFSEVSPDEIDSSKITTDYARSKWTAEKRIWNRWRQGSTALTIVRPTILLDPKSSWVHDVLQLAKKGIPVVPRGKLGNGQFVSASAAGRWLLERAMAHSQGRRALNLTSMEVPWENYFEMIYETARRRVRRFPPGVERVGRCFSGFRGYSELMRAQRSYECSFPLEENFFDWLSKMDQAAENSFQTVDSRTGVTFHPRRVIQIRSERCAEQVLKAASINKIHVNSQGGLHSFRPLYRTHGWLLNWSELRGLKTRSGAEFTFFSGTQMSEVVKTLENQGRSLVNHGEILSQTLAGAVCTGTHGSTWVHGSLSSLVTRVRVLLGNGTWVEWKRGEPKFNRYLIAESRPGVLVEVSVETAPLRNLEERVGFVPVSWALDQGRLLEFARGREYTSVMLYLVQNVARLRWSETTDKPATFNPTVRKAPRWACFLLQRFSSILWTRFLRWFRFFFRGSSRVGTAWSILANEIHPRSAEFLAHDLEIGVLISEAVPAIRAVMDFVQLHKHCSIPMIQLRFQAQESFINSASSRGPVVWIECWINQKTSSDYWEALKKEYQEALAKIDYRIHLGKSAPRSLLSMKEVNESSFVMEERVTESARDEKTKANGMIKPCVQSQVDRGRKTVDHR